MSEEPRWTIRPYRDGDEHAILELFNGVFQEGNPEFQPRTLAHWQWAFRDNPEGHHTYVAELDDRLVGHYTAIPARWRFPDREAHGSQAVDTCVAREFRRSLRRTGLFLSLAYTWFDEFGRDDRDRIVYGFPNPQAFRIGTTRVGYRPVRCPVPERFLRLADADLAAAPGRQVSGFETFDGEVDGFEASLAPHLPFAARRDARYLSWRYAACPTTRYRFLRAETASGELRGMLVYTLGSNNDRRPIVPLVDWLLAPGDLDTWRALLGEVARQAREAGLEGLVAWVPPEHGHDRDLDALGFGRTDSSFNLCIRIHSDAFDLEYARKHWYILMGDSDIY